MTESSVSPVLSLNEIVFQGDAGRVGPLSLEVEAGEDYVLSFETPADATRLIRIIKGMMSPLEGEVMKDGEGVTGWIVRDGIIALTAEEAFFSGTVREELSFAARVGEAKGGKALMSLQAKLLKTSGFDARMEDPVSRLSPCERRRLALTSALLMAPRLIVFQDVLDGCEPVERDRYLALLAAGKESLGFSTLQIFGEGTETFPIFSGRHARDHEILHTGDLAK